MRLSNPEMYDVGWEEAIDMVISVINEMRTRPDMDGQFDTYTLDELEQRIV
jgi:hypothetical protein